MCLITKVYTSIRVCFAIYQHNNVAVCEWVREHRIPCSIRVCLAIWQHATHCNTLQHTATHYYVLVNDSGTLFPTRWCSVSLYRNVHTHSCVKHLARLALLCVSKVSKVREECIAWGLGVCLSIEPHTHTLTGASKMQQGLYPCLWVSERGMHSMRSSCVWN